MGIEVADEELFGEKKHAGPYNNFKNSEQSKLKVREFLNLTTLQGGNDN